MAPVAGIQFDNSELRRLEKKLDKFGEKIFKKVVGQAASKAMSPVLKAARKTVRKDTGAAVKSLGRKTKKYKGQFTVMTIVGARKGFKDPTTGRNPANYMHLIEEGVKPHTIGKGSARVARTSGQSQSQSGTQHPGVPASHAIRRSLVQNKTKVVKLYSKGLKTGIDREAKKR